MATRKNKGGKKQKIYRMKGCSKRHSLGGKSHKCSKSCKHSMKGGGCDPVTHYCGSSGMGGGCGSCGQTGGFGGCTTCRHRQTGGFFNCPTCYKHQKGGNFFKTDLPPVPAPLVGKEWLPEIKGWPGVDGSRNYLANNLYKTDVQTMMKLDGGAKKSWGGKSNSKKSWGGKKNKSRKTKLQGGGLLPQEFVNLGRDLKFNFESTLNSLNGYSAPVNPKVYMDQFAKTNKMLI
uniref:Uncharacterized protein n=1 Tax=viral metagenome TaxID=1070528 RepID=A0A6C0I878_9ZZZZ